MFDLLRLVVWVPAVTYGTHPEDSPAEIQSGPLLDKKNVLQDE